MEYVDPDTLNRFFYRNELVLKEPEGGKKGGDGGKVSLYDCHVDFIRFFLSPFFRFSFIFTANVFSTNLNL